MAAEAVSSREFSEAFAALDSGKQIAVEWALYAIEDDPSPTRPNRHQRPDGFIADGSVDDYAVIYRIVDQGAAIEVWYLVYVPGHRAIRQKRDPNSPPPVM